MTYIQPYTSAYLVTHTDLVKFGVDQTIKPDNAPVTATPANIISPQLYANQFQQVNPLNNVKAFIEIRYTMLQKGYHHKYKAKVIRETGEFLSPPPKGFDSILKFDPETFPNKNTTRLRSVGYWTSENTYISPGTPPIVNE